MTTQINHLRPPSEDIFLSTPGERNRGFKSAMAERLNRWLDKKNSINIEPEGVSVARGEVKDNSAIQMREKIDHGHMSSSYYDIPYGWRIYRLGNGWARLVVRLPGNEVAESKPYPVAGKSGMWVYAAVNSGRIMAVDFAPGVRANSIEDLYLPVDLGLLWSQKPGRRSTARRAAAVVNCVLHQGGEAILDGLREARKEPKADMSEYLQDKKIYKIPKADTSKGLDSKTVYRIPKNL